MFLLCLPFLSRMYRLILKPPTLQFLQFSSTYLIMHHKRKQKFSLIVKPWQQNRANDRNLMITDSITLTDAEWNDRHEYLCRSLNSGYGTLCSDIVCLLSDQCCPLASLFQLWKSGGASRYFLKFILTGKWSLGTWILWICSSLKLQHCRERRPRHVYITVKHLQEWWSEGKDNIKQMKHKNGERQSKDGL